MARRKSKYGAQYPNLSNIIVNNFLTYAQNPDGAKYVDGLKRFASDVNRTNAYRNKVQGYFTALAQTLAEDPTLFTSVLRPVYERIKARTAVVVTAVRR